jgi:hypothetical protein
MHVNVSEESVVAGKDQPARATLLHDGSANFSTQIERDRGRDEEIVRRGIKIHASLNARRIVAGGIVFRDNLKLRIHA